MDTNDLVEQLVKSELTTFVECGEPLAKAKTRTIGGEQYYADGPNAGKKVGTVRGESKSDSEPKKGSEVNTKHGKAVVQSINTSTYSIPMAIVKLSEGKHEGETMMVSVRELTSR